MADPDLLLRYAAGALDPARVAGVDAALAADPALRRTLDRLTAELDGGLPGGAPWRLPPPGLGLSAGLAAAPVMGPTRLRIGDRFHVDVGCVPRPDQTGVVVLRRLWSPDSGGWRVLAPDLPAAAPAASRLPAGDAASSFRVPLRARGPAGLQRWAVALLPLPLPVGDDEDDPWAGVRTAIARGVGAVGTTEIQVLAR